MQRITRNLINQLVENLQDCGFDIYCYSSNGNLKFESKKMDRTYATGLTTKEAYYWIVGFSFCARQAKEKLEDQA